MLAEIVLTDDAYRTMLDDEVLVQADQAGLVLEGASVRGGRLAQEIGWCPQALQVWLEAPSSLPLQESAEGSPARARTLAPGVQAITLPAGPRIRLQAPSVRLLAAQALGSSRSD
jgi:hypothetical protein